MDPNRSWQRDFAVMRQIVWNGYSGQAFGQLLPGRDGWPGGEGAIVDRSLEQFADLVVRASPRLAQREQSGGA